MFRIRFSPFSALLAVLLGGVAYPHPVPDLLVHSRFESGGSVEVRVEVDPRAFEDHPEEHDYLEKSVAESVSSEELAALGKTADGFVASRLKFHFEPLGEVVPDFSWEFRKLGDTGPLVADDDPAVLVGSWKTSLPAGLAGYRVESLKLTDPDAIPMNVVFLNHLDGKFVERYAVLFPGEKSFVLDVAGMASPLPSSAPKSVGQETATGDLAAPFFSEVKRGFLQVLPLGLDHVLFILGLFLFSRRCRPLLYQVSAFALAHTLTLWLASAGVVNVPATLVEPLIAASLVAIAVENLLRREYRHSRLIVVFVFGLVHGLGFAGAMGTRLDSAGHVLGLLGINLGIELGQLAVIALAFGATCWIKDEATFRKLVVVPGSILIALVGVWWIAERTLS